MEVRTCFYAENICSFKKLDYCLNQSKATLIFGENKDNDSQQSNGSGKSALIECIAVGITGSPLRKIKTDEIINDSEENCFIHLELYNPNIEERFSIERSIPRKGVSVIKCNIERNGECVNTDEAVKHSVDAYNRYILEKIGVSKEDLFNYFILSKHKYQNFLSCPDKEKKEIINHFSNGVLVDEAINKLIEDREPIGKELLEVTNSFNRVDGKLEVLREQLQQKEKNREQNALCNKDRILSLTNGIAEKREKIRGIEQELEGMSKELLSVESLESELQDLEQQKLSFSDSYNGIVNILSPFDCISRISDWNKVINENKQKIKEAKERETKYELSLLEAQDKLLSLNSKFSTIQDKYRDICKDYDSLRNEFDCELESIEKRYVDLNVKLSDSLDKKYKISKAIEFLNSRLAGTIECPFCKHVFLLSDKDFNIEDARQKLKVNEDERSIYEKVIRDTECLLSKLDKDKVEITSKRRKQDEELRFWKESVSKIKSEVKLAELDIENILSSQKRIVNFINSYESDIEHSKRRMFDEAFSVVDELYRVKQKRKSLLEQEIESLGISIENMQESIENLKESKPYELSENLKSKIKEFEKKSETILKEKSVLEKKVNKLSEQEQIFIRFKTYLANTKIEALSKVTNEFLENIGSDLRLMFSGFTVLKTGKVREKISTSILRSGYDCGSFGKLSEGEAARINLATILAMQKLTNASCDIDKGLDLLILDEILEAVDEDGLAYMFSALNNLQITSLVVSHGNVAESYPYYIRVIKENGISTIMNN